MIKKLLIYSEINEFDIGLTIELWNRGMLWDKLLGVSWLPLMQINHSLPSRVIIVKIRIKITKGPLNKYNYMN